MNNPVAAVQKPSGLPFPLSDGTRVEIASTAPWTPDRCDDLIEWLRFYKERLARREASKMLALVLADEPRK